MINPSEFISNRKISGIIVGICLAEKKMFLMPLKSYQVDEKFRLWNLPDLGSDVSSVLYKLVTLDKLLNFSVPPLYNGENNIHLIGL